MIAAALGGNIAVINLIDEKASKKRRVLGKPNGISTQDV
jgi:hypothetical protein